jgi:hypothetical protein
MEARERCAIGLVRPDPDGRKHPLSENPGLAAYWLAGRCILQCGSVCEQHHRCILRTVGEDPFRSGIRKGKLHAARQPLLKLGKRFVTGLHHVRQLRWLRRWPFRGRCRFQPVARLFLDGDVDAGVQPPRERAPGLFEADMLNFPTHRCRSLRH